MMIISFNNIIFHSSWESNIFADTRDTVSLVMPVGGLTWFKMQKGLLLEPAPLMAQCSQRLSDHLWANVSEGQSFCHIWGAESESLANLSFLNQSFLLACYKQYLLKVLIKTTQGASHIRLLSIPCIMTCASGWTRSISAKGVGTFVMRIGENSTQGNPSVRVLGLFEVLGMSNPSLPSSYFVEVC